MTLHDHLADDAVGRRTHSGPHGDGIRAALAVTGIALAALVVAALAAYVVNTAG